MTETVDLSEHEFRSLRRWLNQIPMFSGWDIFLQRPPGQFDRPALVIRESVPRRFEDRGRGFGVHSLASWQIEVLVTEFWAAKRGTAEISRRLLTSLKVPLYLWGWSYPLPVVTEIADEGSLPEGEISVIVTAVNSEGEESLGQSTVVEVAAGSAIGVVIAPWPRQARVAERYRVYAGAEGSETLQTQVVDLADSPVPEVVTMASLTTTGASPPTSSVLFHRFMNVMGVQTDVLEHPDADGLFNGIVSLQTSVLSQRSLDVALGVEEILTSVVLDG